MTTFRPRALRLTTTRSISHPVDAESVMDVNIIEIDDHSILDIQVKRLHEYKRQQMNALYVIHKYLEIKGGKLPKRPITIMFGAKAAPS